MEDLTFEVEQEVDGRWIAEAPTLPGVMAYGRSREEAVRRARALAELVLESKNGEEELFKN